MEYKNISNRLSLIQDLKDKDALFALALSNSATADIDGITQAGLPGQIYLTPTLDAEFLLRGSVPSLGKMPETPKGVPTPCLITRAVSQIKPFIDIKLLDLGLRVKPKVDSRYIKDFGIKPSGSIDKGAGIDAEKIFKKGYQFGKKWRINADYVIVGESVPSGTTTATATALALGYDAEGLFSSSFKNVPNIIKDRTINSALSLLNENDNIFEKLSKVSDNMLIFIAGLVLGVNSRFPLVLAGGTQMAGALMVANTIAQDIGLNVDSSKLMLWTTKWVAKDLNSDIASLLNMLSFKVEAIYPEFDFSKSEHPALKLYDLGEAKEGVGAGGALVYAAINNIEDIDIINKVESFLNN